MSLAWGNFIIGSGRAVLYPVYKGTYQRSTSAQMGSNAERELRTAWSRDLGRAIDYLETRSDIDGARLGFYGVSAGAAAGVILTALEPRLKVSVLQGAGFWDEVTPEIDPLNYAPRVLVPTLMLNGRYDFESPFETAQRPLFALLGSPAEHKRHTVLETGHALPMEDVAARSSPGSTAILDRWSRRHPPRLACLSPTAAVDADAGRLQVKPCSNHASQTQLFGSRDGGGHPEWPAIDLRGVSLSRSRWCNQFAMRFQLAPVWSPMGPA